jgi:Cu-Zn family superoxide dismutase
MFGQDQVSRGTKERFLRPYRTCSDHNHNPALKRWAIFFVSIRAMVYTSRQAGVSLNIMKRNLLSLIVLLFAVCLLFTNATAQDATPLAATLSPSSGSQVKGTVTFTPTADGTQIVADITGLKPGKHGIHIHEKGDCSAPDASSAGPHFNPTHSHHGGPHTAERHAGDFGNVEADASGKVHFELKEKDLKLSGPDSIMGKSVVVHEKDDDLKTDPAGNSGARIACGVIAAVK